MDKAQLTEVWIRSWWKSYLFCGEWRRGLSFLKVSEMQGFYSLLCS